MQTTRMRTRKCSTLARPETFEDEAGGEREAALVHVSAGEALAHARPTRTLEDRLNQEAICGKTHKPLLHKGSLPPPQQERPMNNNKALELALIGDVKIAKSLDILPRLAREGHAQLSRINVHNVGSPYPMVRVTPQYAYA